MIDIDMATKIPRQTNRHARQRYSTGPTRELALLLLLYSFFVRLLHTLFHQHRLRYSSNLAREAEAGPWIDDPSLGLGWRRGGAGKENNANEADWTEA